MADANVIEINIPIFTLHKYRDPVDGVNFDKSKRLPTVLHIRNLIFKCSQKSNWFF